MTHRKCRQGPAKNFLPPRAGQAAPFPLVSLYQEHPLHYHARCRPDLTRRETQPMTTPPFTVARLRADGYAENHARQFVNWIKGTPPPPPAAPDNAAVRAWAEVQGLKCSARGKIPAGVLAAYQDAHR